MLDDLTSTQARTSKRRRKATNQPPTHEAAPLWAEELATDESIEAPPEVVFWDKVAIVSVTAAVLVGVAIGVPFGVYLHGTL
jgi:hypothetical protein